MDKDLKITIINKRFSWGTTDTTIIHKSQLFLYFSSDVNFSTKDSVVCLGTSTAFFDSTISNTTIASWNWTFGDGSTSTLQNPVYIYPTPGNDTVQLIITTTNGCADTLTKNNYVHIYGPSAKFSALPVTVCKGSSVIFMDKIGNEDALLFLTQF